jgi:hypothetical protein
VIGTDTRSTGVADDDADDIEAELVTVSDVAIDVGCGTIDGYG